MPRDIAIYGGSFNVPGVHHRAVVQTILDIAPEFRKPGVPTFDLVHPLPCGFRPDKQSVNRTPRIYRAYNTDLTFVGLPKVEPHLWDLERPTFATTREVDDYYKRLYPHDRVWHVIGSDLVKEKDLSCPIKSWSGGEKLWGDLRWAILQRKGYPQLSDADLPPQGVVVGEGVDELSSSMIRDLRYHDKPYEHLVTPGVAAFVERYDLYRGGAPTTTSILQPVDDPKFLFVVDRRKAKALDLAERFREFETKDPVQARGILVFGGDGTVHEAAQLWRHRLPIVALNCGTVGYLCNDPAAFTPDRLRGPLHANLQTMLHVELTYQDGRFEQRYAFQDVYMKAVNGGGTAQVRVDVNDVTRFPQVVGDCVLVCAPAGTTAYASHMGVTQSRPDTRAIWIAFLAANIKRPVTEPFGTSVRMTVLDTDKRPCHAYLDGKEFPNVASVTTRTSHIAAVELAFVPERDMMAKFNEFQYARESH